MSNTEHPLPIPECAGYNEAEVHYHLSLCEDAGYLVLHQARWDHPARRFAGIIRMTWAGHEALNDFRAGAPPQEWVAFNPSRSIQPVAD